MPLGDGGRALGLPLRSLVSNDPSTGVSILMRSSVTDNAVDATTDTQQVALVRRALAGDREAFAQLVRIYQRRAVSVAYRLLGNGEDAADVSQDAFVRAFRHLSQLDDPSRFGPWLMRVVTNLALNYRRSRRLRLAAPLDEAITATGEGRHPGTGRRARTQEEDDERGPLPRELHDTVSRAMETLPEKQRLALILFSIEGMPQKDVADILDCSIELVKWNVFQARKKLKEQLAEYL